MPETAKTPVKTVATSHNGDILLNQCKKDLNTYLYTYCVLTLKMKC